ncbi:zona pellucida sperm-binding protein 3-like [Pseudoliparis swirei]|uniref:zona pellucida sperm-binding protein 3-like n=1 Tax=Pseudoliparis swirei TaxID=2059687 RepID=UPI0024BDB4FD|nr:zona pellucida sperm-binding protein 3-like [Pseudoliparis swirei]
MTTHLYLGVVLLALFAAPVENNADIKVVCAKGSVNIKWMISEELVPHAARFFLGTCMPSHLTVLPTGEGEVVFNYKLADCRFKRLMKGKNVIFQNELTFRPQPRSKPAAFVYPIECVYKRPDGWIPAFLNPGFGVSEGRGSLVFHMALLNAELTSIAKTNVVPLGSFMPIWAAVEQKSHQPLLLLIEECVATASPELHPGSQVHPIISNKGCLLDSKRGNSMFLPRYQSSALTIYLQAFQLVVGQEVYIHCKLVAWDPEKFDESKKACHYTKESQSWELLDDPSMSGVCSCCDSTCKSRNKRGVDWETNAFSHHSVLGPLIIIDPSANNVSGGPV